MFNSRWAKMEKYYNKTNQSPAYIAAIILDPNAKWKYIKNNQKKEQQREAKSMIESLQGEYKPMDSTSFSLTTSTQSRLEAPQKNVFAAWKQRH